MPPLTICCFYLSLFLQILGLFLFFTGFLPVSTVSKHESDASGRTCKEGGKIGSSNQPKIGPRGKQLVLMIVDALREDFVFEGNRMPYLQKLIKEKKTLSFLAKSYPPTVTLPRIKSMVTGTVPGFIDVVINLASTELKEDNIILKLHHMDKKINFFGDDTWLKLFPNCFMRHDGTTSFVVSDYKEVDDNVTRHLPYELLRNDWDVLILHFLGLDHIGHSAGPASPLIGPKLLEMDQIVQQITEALSKKNTFSNQDVLFILTSDHGMNDAGSHGGASPAEILSPLIFTSPFMMLGNGENFTRRHVNQVDLAPSIAAFFNSGIPKNSIGAVILDLLKFQPVEAGKEQLRKNICQISKQSIQADSAFLSAYCNVSQASLQNETIQFLAGILKELSSHIQSQSSEYQIDKMNFGLSFLCLSWIFTLIPLRKCLYGALDLWFGLLIILHSLLITSTSYIEEEHQFWYFTTTTSIFVIFLSDQQTLLKIFSRDAKTSKKGMAESYNYAAPYFAALVIFRITRAWNQTGIKWLSQKDISSFLLLSDNRKLLSVLVFMSLALFLYLYFWKASKFYQTVSAVALLFVFIHKVITLKGSTFWPFSINGVVEAKVVFTVCLLLLFSSIISHKVHFRKQLRTIPALSRYFGNCLYIDDRELLKKTEKFKNSKQPNEHITSIPHRSREYGSEDRFFAFLLLYIILQRPHNIVWACLISMMEKMMNLIRCQRFTITEKEVSLVVLHYCLGKASFHAQGHSNSLASVDISAAFVGANYYSPLLSGFLTSVATYGSHIFWFFSLKRFIQKTWTQNNDTKWTIRYIYNAILSLECIILCSITYLNRYHLFIWTVFAPKFLFLLTFRLFMSIIILII